jgi:PAS domain S-box-containing protein
MQSTLLNLTLLGFLCFWLASVQRMRHERRLALWTKAWFLLLLNAALPLWSSTSPVILVGLSILHHVLLALVALVLMLSCVRQPETTRDRTLYLAFASTPLIAILLAQLHLSNRLWLYLSLVATELVGIYTAQRILPAAHRRAAQAAIAVAALLLFLTSTTRASMLPRHILAQLFLLVAILFWNKASPAGRSTGAVTASVGAFLWAILFPLTTYFGHLTPSLIQAPSYWNFPKFLLAFGMLLILHEEDMANATELTDKYRVLFDRHPLPMWVFHAESHRFLTVNDAALAHYGYTRDEFLGMTVEQIRPPESIPRLHQVLTVPNREIVRSTGWKHLLKDRTLIDVDVFSHDIQYQHQPARIVVAVDVSQRNAAEEQLRQAHKLESLGQLTGGVAHDFNNILAIILGNLEMIAQRRPVSEAAPEAEAGIRDHIEQAIHSVHRGADLTRRLLAYARQQPLAPRVVSIARLIDETVSFLRSTLGPTIQIETTAEPTLWDAQIDPGQLENALLNLAVNARDAMPHGGNLTIRSSNLHLDQTALGEIPPGEYVLLSIADTGSGMPPDVIARATEPFFTTKPVGQGTGLGLSMVYGFLKQSGGHLQIESQINAGTSIHLYLPRAHPAVPATPAANPASFRRRLPRGGKERILVVEDEHAIRTVLVSILRTLGYTVLEAEDGPTALTHLRQPGHIDLLLTDVVLPNGISGGLLAADARILRPGIKVLFSSGYTRNVLIRDRRLEEGVHLLTKPFHLAELATAVRQVLDLTTA